MRILNRTITVVIALLLTLGVFAPQTAHAAPNPASLTIAPTTTDGTPITGGTWTITQTATINPATGASTPVAGTPVTVDAGATTPLAQYAVYTVTQATRAPGYYLDTETYTVEFPLLTGGQWATDQSLTIAPKLTPVTGDASLVKQANGTTTPIEGATFELYRTVDASGATLPTPELVTTVTTGADGTVSATALTEGSYYWIETSVPAPYAVDTTTTYPFQVTVDAAGTATAPIEQAVAQNYTAPAASEVIKAVNGGPTTSASVGETVTFTITATLPGDIDQFDAYTLTDTFDARFSSVTVADPVPAGFAADVTGNTVTLTGTPASLTPGEVTFTITAVVNNTTASGDSIPNTATVTWDNGRGDAGTFVTNAATVTLVEGLDHGHQDRRRHRGAAAGRDVHPDRRRRHAAHRHRRQSVRGDHRRRRPAGVRATAVRHLLPAGDRRAGRVPPLGAAHRGDGERHHDEPDRHGDQLLHLVGAARHRNLGCLALLRSRRRADRAVPRAAAPSAGRRDLSGRR